MFIYIFINVHLSCVTCSGLYRTAEKHLWIGLHDKTNESAFEWVDGTPVCSMTVFLFILLATK